MKILVVSQYYYPEPFRINEICEELVRRGHDVTVLTGCPNYPDGVIYDGYDSGHWDETVNGVRVIRCKIRPRKTGALNLFLNYLSFWMKAGRKIRSFPDSFDVVYSYQLSPITSCKPACRYAKKYKKPHLIYCLDIWPESIIENVSSASPIYKLVKHLSRSVYSSASEICVTSPSFIDYLSALLFWPKDRFVYIPQHARDIDSHGEGGTDDVLNIVFTGNIGASQNLDVLVDAVSRIKDEARVRVTIVGSGSDSKRLMERVRNEGLSDVIVFTGRQPKEKMAQYYAMADFCFLSLRDEGAVSWTIPGKLQEYMSAGKSVLAAINGDTRFLLEDARCGVCVDYNDPAGLASLIVKYSKDKSILATWGKNARDYYLSHFTLESHVDALEKELIRLNDGNRS